MPWEQLNQSLIILCSGSSTYRVSPPPWFIDALTVVPTPHSAGNDVYGGAKHLATFLESPFAHGGDGKSTRGTSGCQVPCLYPVSSTCVHLAGNYHLRPMSTQVICQSPARLRRGWMWTVRRWRDAWDARQIDSGDVRSNRPRNDPRNFSIVEDGECGLIPMPGEMGNGNCRNPCLSAAASMELSISIPSQEMDELIRLYLQQFTMPRPIRNI